MPDPLRSRLDALPLFADDLELAEAIVGKKRAKKWALERLPTLAGKPGFPAIDPFHGGRPVPLVRRFYEQYLGMTGARPGAAGRENPDAWRRSPGKRQAP